MMARSVKTKWLLGRTALSTRLALQICCENSGKSFWVPRYAISNMRRNIAHGAHLFLIESTYDGFENLKALDRAAVQSLLNNDAALG